MRLAKSLAALITLTFLVFVVADVFLWVTHPAAVLLGRAAGSMMDPLLLAGALVIGLAYGADWKAVVGAILLSAGIEFFVILHGNRELLGEPNHFKLESFAARAIAVCFLATVIGGINALRKNWVKPSND
ncbi:MAG: hypothetical protein AAF127_00340 [Pseudomonadota bacterium]